MNMKALAEAIILQSLEDLWDERHRKESLEFFKGQGFGVYSGIAGLRNDDKESITELFGHMGIDVRAEVPAAEPEEIITVS